MSEEILRDLNNKINNRIEDNFIEAYSLIENYLMRLLMSDNNLEKIEARDMRYLIADYFKTITTRLQPNISDLLNATFRRLDSNISKDKNPKNVDRFLSDELLQEIDSLFKKEINKGLESFSDYFLSDFRATILRSLPLSNEMKVQVYNAMAEVKRSIEIKLEEIMYDFKNESISRTAILIESAKDDYKKTILNGEELNDNRGLEIQKQYENNLKAIFLQFKNEMMASPELTQKYKELLHYYKLLVSQKVDFSKLTKNQKNRQEFLFSEFMKELDKYYKKLEAEKNAKKQEQTKEAQKIEPSAPIADERKERNQNEIKEKSNSALSKMKPIKKEVRKEEKDEELQAILRETDIETERQKIINAKHLTPEKKEEALKELDIMFGLDQEGKIKM